MFGSMAFAEHSMLKSSPRSPIATSKRRQVAAATSANAAAQDNSFSKRHRSVKIPTHESIPVRVDAAAVDAHASDEDEEDCKVVAEETVEQRNERARTFAIDLEDE